MCRLWLLHGACICTQQQKQKQKQKLSCLLPKTEPPRVVADQLPQARGRGRCLLSAWRSVYVVCCQCVLTPPCKPYHQCLGAAGPMGCCWPHGMLHDGMHEWRKAKLKPQAPLRAFVPPLPGAQSCCKSIPPHILGQRCTM